MTSRPYAEHAAAYLAAGWAPLPIAGKYPPPRGWTGADAPYPSAADVQAWIEDHGDMNIGLRMPPNVLGIDVDAYDGKPGAGTLEAAIDRYGPLPDTWISSSRDEGVSGIRFYRVPPGLAWPGELPGGGVELIQARHRYAIAWPSIHPSGRTYQWWHHDVPAEIPNVDDLPDLPEPWVEGVALGQATDIAKADLADTDIGPWLNKHGHGPACPLMRRAIDRGLADLATGASRHDVASRAIARVCHLTAEGHTGGLAAIGELAGAFAKAVADPSRQGELVRLIAGAVRIAAATETRTFDPCDGGVFAPLTPTTPRTDVFAGLANVPGLANAAPVAGLANVDGLANGEPVADAERTPSSWAPVDLTDILEGRHGEQAPVIGWRTDGHALFYLGRVNGLIGPSESGKSWVALEVCRQAITTDQHVVYLDFEDTAVGVVGRLRGMGVDAATVATYFHYIGPDEAPTAEAFADLTATLDKYRPTVVVLDGFNAAMSLAGLDLMSNTDATRFYQGLLRPIVADDRAIIYVDHTPKANDESKGGIGAQAKRAMTSGCAIRVDKKGDFGKGTVGYLKLTVDKDRAGLVREQALYASQAGTAVVEETAGVVTVTIQAPEEKTEESELEKARRRTGYLESVSAWIFHNSPASGNDAVKGTGRARKLVLDACKALEADGYLRRTGQRYEHVKLYSPDVFGTGTELVLTGTDGTGAEELVTGTPGAPPYGGPVPVPPDAARLPLPLDRRTGELR